MSNKPSQVQTGEAALRAPVHCMSHELLFISDLHLSLEKRDITRRFLQFLQTRAIQAKALYILGDLFDTWIGDDDNTPPNKTIKAALRDLVDRGTSVYLIQGNRDFLLGERFSQETGVVVLDDYAVIDIGGQATLLTHGDLLCTDDLPYQAFRVKSRSAEWQQHVLSKPLWLRLLAARWYRVRSFFHKRGKTQDIMDVNLHTVLDCLRRFGCRRLIHGHTHRPATYRIELDGVEAQRIVLADWTNDRGEVLRWDGQDFHREVL